MEVFNDADPGTSIFSKSSSHKVLRAATTVGVKLSIQTQYLASIGHRHQPSPHKPQPAVKLVLEGFVPY